MYRNTRFGQLLKGLSRGAFEQVVRHHQADKHSKGFCRWDQLIAMLYAQLSGCRSLRELEEGFNSHAVHHYHLGSRTIKRSTLADANANCTSDVFAAFCRQLLEHTHRKAKKELQTLLYLLDATPIPLKGLGYDSWTQDHHSHRTQGLKAHVVLAPEAQGPVHLTLTAPNVNDIVVGRVLPLEAGATYVFDKGYCDYSWWYAIHQQGAYFVTRLKKNAGITPVTQRDIPAAAHATIQEDTVIHFTHKYPGGQRINPYVGTPLRRVVVTRPDTATPLVLVTNDFNRSAEQIAALYKKRWDIELFFKWLKQNLRIKQFLGRSENAVKIQIYTALITYLLVQHYRQRHGVQQSLTLFLAGLRSGLFQRPEIEEKIARKQRYRRQTLQNLQGSLGW